MKIQDLQTPMSGCSALSNEQALRSIVVVGLGYVGLPLAVALAKHQPLIGYDADPLRISELGQGYDKTASVSNAELSEVNLTLTSDQSTIRQADFYIVVVPTPITAEKKPDLSALIAASEMVGSCLKRGDIVVYESSVYPGVTEEVCIPLLEKQSKLVNGIDFTVGYSPERTNYGDTEHALSRVVKVIAAQDPATAIVIKQVYGNIIDAGLCEARSIRVAEVAKLVENIQRDVNIALMNEIAMLVNSMGLSTAEVLRVAGTKWNFLDFKPGLVGGHCVPVDPHYLIHSASETGGILKLISCARDVNDGMPEYIVNKTIDLLGSRPSSDFSNSHVGSTDTKLRIGIFGLTFKGDCPDIRESQALKIIRHLHSFGFQTMVYDPLADAAEVLARHNLRLLSLSEIENLSAIIFTVPHKEFDSLTPGCLKRHLLSGAPIIDVPGVLNASEFADAGLHVWQL